MESGRILLASEQPQVENFLIKKFGKVQSDEIIRGKLEKENSELRN